MERGSLRVRSQDELFEAKQAMQTTLANRAIFAAFTIALLVASCVMLSLHPAGWIGHLAIIVLITDSAFLLALLLGMLRSGRF